jgi:hypothetical protein
MNRQARLKEEALGRWNAVDPATRTRLREELLSWAPGTALIELDALRCDSSYKRDSCQARIIRLTFGTLLHPDCRYLSHADISPPAP